MRYQIRDPRAAHFITATVVEWLPIFTTGACCDIVVQALLFAQQQRGLLIHAWVIMDNHFHAVVGGQDLAIVIGNLKKFTARRLVDQIQTESRKWLLNDLHFFRGSGKARSDYQVWQEGSHPEAILSDAMMQQKLDYLHANPVRRGWVSAPEHWRYSSAHEWLPGAMPPLRCDPWR